MRTLPHTWFQKPPLGTGIDYSFPYPPSAVFLFNEQLNSRFVSDPAGRNVGTVTNLSGNDSFTVGRFGSGLDGRLTNYTSNDGAYVTVSSPTAAVTNMVLAASVKATWLAWVRINPFRHGGVLAMKTDDGTSGGWRLSLTPAVDPYYTFVVELIRPTSNTAVYQPLPAIVWDTWTQLVVTVDGSTLLASSISIFVNGVKQTITAPSMFNGIGSATSDAAQPLYVGAGPTPITNNWFDGIMDHFALWNGTALSAGQIAELYENPFAFMLPPALNRLWSIPAAVPTTSDAVFVF